VVLPCLLTFLSYFMSFCAFTLCYSGLSWPHAMLWLCCWKVHVLGTWSPVQKCWEVEPLGDDWVIRNGLVHRLMLWWISQERFCCKCKLSGKVTMSRHAMNALCCVSKKPFTSGWYPISREFPASRTVSQIILCSL
jgi:hypothetical protein